MPIRHEKITPYGVTTNGSPAIAGLGKGRFFLYSSPAGGYTGAFPAHLWVRGLEWINYEK
jgi:hypothetical protein